MTWQKLNQNFCCIRILKEQVRQDCTSEFRYYLVNYGGKRGLNKCIKNSLIILKNIQVLS